MILHFIHKLIYHNEPFNNQYVIDNEYQSLIFAVGTEVFCFSKDLFFCINNFEYLASSLCL